MRTYDVGEFLHERDEQLPSKADAEPTCLRGA